MLTQRVRGAESRIENSSANGPPRVRSKGWMLQGCVSVGVVLRGAVSFGVVLRGVVSVGVALRGVVTFGDILRGVVFCSVP